MAEKQLDNFTLLEKRRETIKKREILPRELKYVIPLTWHSFHSGELF